MRPIEIQLEVCYIYQAGVKMRLGKVNQFLMMLMAGFFFLVSSTDILALVNSNGIDKAIIPPDIKTPLPNPKKPPKKEKGKKIAENKPFQSILCQGNFSLIKNKTEEFRIVRTSFSHPQSNTHEKKKQAGAELKYLVAKGSSYFSQSFAYYQFFISNVEETELEKSKVKTLKHHLILAKLNLEAAKEIYMKQKVIFDNASFNENVLAELARFPFAQFQEEIKPIKEIFQQVQKCLKKGNIRQIPQKFITQSEKIIEKLNTLIGKLKPDGSNLVELVTLIQSLNSDYVETMMFGQYVAQIFAKIDVTAVDPSPKK